MTVMKSHRFAASVHMRAAGAVHCESGDKPGFRVAVPPEFHGTHEGLWSPEELLVSSVASCFALTLGSVAEHRGLPLHEVEVRAVGHVERRDRRYEFTLVEVDATIETDPGLVADAEQAARLAGELCPVGRALAVPLRYRIDAGARMGEAAPVG